MSHVGKDLWQFEDFLLNLQQGILLRRSERIPLAPKPFQILADLVVRQGAVATKQELMERVWPDTFVEESSLTQCIFVLRKALAAAGSPDIIETISKRGYRISVPVHKKGEANGPVLEAGNSSGSDPARDPLPVAVAPSVVQPLETTAPPDIEQAAAPARLRSVSRWNGVVSWLVLPLALLVTLGLARSLSERPAVLSAVRLTSDGLYKERLLTLLSDEHNIHFSEDADAAAYLATVPVTGGEVKRTPAPGALDSAMAISPASGEILFGPLWEQRQEQPFTMLSPGGGTVRTLGSLSGHAAAWSRDGERLAFARHTSILTADRAGNNPREIIRLQEEPYWLRWSPDGSRLRFSMRHPTENAGIWEVREDGSNLRPVFQEQSWADQACCGDWTPDGRYYVFVRSDDRRSSLWISRDSRAFWRSSKPLRLAEGPVDFWRAPVVARDGSHIFALGEEARGELVGFDRSSARFQSYLNGLSTDTISFSRDGRWMAWTAYPEGTLWRSRVDGTERMRLTDEGKIARFPQWSPDGTKISYITTATNRRWKVFYVASTGGAAKAALPDDTDQGVATWSPDGSELVFGELVRFGVSRTGEQHIRTVNLKTGRVTTIPGSDGLWTARLSPTGEYLSAVTVDNHRLLLLNRRTSQWTVVSEMGTNDCAWSRDGQSLYFDSPSQPTIYRVNVRTLQVEKYADLSGLRRTGFFGWSLNLTPDDTPLVLKEAGINEVYSLSVHLP